MLHLFLNWPISQNRFLPTTTQLVCELNGFSNYFSFFNFFLANTFRFASVCSYFSMHLTKTKTLSLDDSKRTWRIPIVYRQHSFHDMWFCIQNPLCIEEVWNYYFFVLFSFNNIQYVSLTLTVRLFVLCYTNTHTRTIYCNIDSCIHNTWAHVEHSALHMCMCRVWVPKWPTNVSSKNIRKNPMLFANWPQQSVIELLCIYLIAYVHFWYADKGQIHIVFADFFECTHTIDRMAVCIAIIGKDVCGEFSFLLLIIFDILINQNQSSNRFLLQS